MRLRLGLLDRDAPEDAVVTALDLPPIFEIGLKLIGGAVVGGAVLGTLLLQDGLYVANLFVVAIGAAPWAYWIVRGFPKGVATAPFVLGPAVVTLVVDALLGADRGLGLGPFLLQYAWMLGLVGCVFARRRHATIVVALTYVIFLLRSLQYTEPVGAAVSWTLAVSFLTAGVVGVRLGAASIALSEQATAERKALEDRRDIARDVHDVVAHTLAVTMLHITAARMAVNRAAVSDAIEALEEAERHGRAGLGDIRRTIRVLRSDSETPLDMAQPRLADLPELVGRYRAAGLPVGLAVHGAAQDVPDSTGLAVYRIAQEALANAARHGAGRTTVELRIADGAIVLGVENPVGRTRTGDAHGTGLDSMRERTAAAGGLLVVGPRDGSWVVDARIPVDDIAETAHT